MTTKIKTVLAALVLLFVVTMTYGFMRSASDQETVNTEFRYIGATASYTDLIQESNWEINDGNNRCNPGTTLPCVIAPNMSSITNTLELVAHLEDLSVLQSPAHAEEFVDVKTTEKRD